MPKGSISPKIICVVGPTASGKSELAVKLAKKFKGEIVSCDSRQIYRGMDIGTGKVAGSWKPVAFFRSRKKTQQQRFVYKSISHHCIDYVNPKKQYSVSEFKRDAQKAIGEITSRGRVPILCGGTGHWVDAVVFNQNIPEVKPNTKLRAKLEKQSAEKLFEQLQKLDPVRASSIDRFNKRRLIRALEIVISTGQPVPAPSSHTLDPSVLWIGINLPQEDLYKKIDKRLKQRLEEGMVKEVKQLHKQGLSWKKLEAFGLEYKFVSLYLQKKLTYDEMFTQLSYAIKHYAKRQMTWFKRNKQIHWVKNYQEAEKLVKK